MFTESKGVKVKETELAAQVHSILSEETMEQLSWRFVEMIERFNHDNYRLANNLPAEWNFGPEWALRVIGVMPSLTNQ